MTASSGPALWVGAVVVEVDRLLLVRRSSPPEAGRWSVPAVAVAEDEPLVAAVVRAVEAAGLEGVGGRLLGCVEQFGEGHRVLLAYEATALVEGAPASGASWVRLDEVTDRPLVEGLAELLADRGILRLIV